MELDAERTCNFMPVIPRLDRLDRLLQLLEEKHSLLRRDFSGNNNNCAYTTGNDACKTLTTVLEEVQHKGTLMERLSTLENRVLQLSLEMDEEENTSKYSSSSTFQICSETSGKKDSDISIPSRQEQEDLEPIIQPQEGASSAHEFVTKRRAQDKSKGGNQKRKIQRKWLGLFRFRLTC